MLGYQDVDSFVCEALDQGDYDYATELVLSTDVSLGRSQRNELLRRIKEAEEAES